MRGNDKVAPIAAIRRTSENQWSRPAAIIRWRYGDRPDRQPVAVRSITV